MKACGELFRHTDGSLMLDPAKKKIKGERDEGSSAKPCCLLPPEETENPWDKKNPRKDQIDDEGEVQGVSVIRKRGKDHRSIRGEEVEQHMAHEHWKTDCVETPKIRTLRHLHK